VADLPVGAASHARYLSGLLLGLGLASLWCAARLGERRGAFAVLCLVVIAGGVARAAGLALDGPPPWEHVAALAMELGVVPALLAASRRVPHA
jgi:peptidoglycan/LPS O-acetylase OafA/YrhL